ncbi:MAG: hypothetical protein EOM20_00025 [Spartobacteria bacterium]|nr:hypothetical protein [Spartobacteria bacterium]
MNKQLVIQFSGKSITDYDLLTKIEESLEVAIASDADIDGHDFGHGEMNIYIFTNNPIQTFSSVKNVIESYGLLHDMKAAYRNPEEETFTTLWPEGLKEFAII